MKFGDLIRKSRLDQELTLEEVASALGSSKGWLSAIELNRQTPALDSAVLLMRRLQIPLGKLVLVNFEDRREKDNEESFAFEVGRI